MFFVPAFAPDGRQNNEFAGPAEICTGAIIGVIMLAAQGKYLFYASMNKQFAINGP
nr:hypothetical protein [uncultured Chitinophaga sp.]